MDHSIKKSRTLGILSFKPGVYFDQVEIHHQEHGLYMLRGQGIYYFAGKFHEVKQDDLIYMMGRGVSNT